MTKTNGIFARAHAVSIGLIVLGAITYGFALDRYPSFMIDEAYFAFPALKAAQGGTFTYAVSQGAPFANEIWAYHGPLFPHLLELLFRLFGFSLFITRLPEFLCGWSAVLLLVLFLNSRGYRNAGLAFAVLWCGDRSTQELMFGRMEGIALLSVVISFLLLRVTWQRHAIAPAFLCGLFCGLSVLIHPVCLSFAVIALFFTWYSARWKAMMFFCLGGSLDGLFLLLLWKFQVRKSVVQFLWHAHQVQAASAFRSLSEMLNLLKWSRYWFVALLLFSLASIIIAAVLWFKKGKNLDGPSTDLLLASGFALASLQSIFSGPMYPYYVVYFSVWPMLCLVILSERYWRQMRLVAVAMTVVWCTSGAWNILRVRESIKFYRSLNNRFIYQEFQKDVPAQAKVLATPSVYSIPIGTGRTNLDLTTSSPESEDVCANCYVIMSRSDYQDAKYLVSTNLHRRSTLYAGPAFPGAGPLNFPVIVLSPEIPSASLKP